MEKQRFIISSQREGRMPKSNNQYVVVPINPGDTFNHWTVIEYVGYEKCKTKWSCRCKCGKIKNVASISLRRGWSQSCGCVKYDLRKRQSKPLKHKFENLEGEIWRAIPGYDGNYEASSYGRIRSFSHNPQNSGLPKLKKQVIKMFNNDKLPYYFVTVRKNGGAITKSVHGLVLAAFCGEKPEGMECRHLDGNSLNNSISNLKWGTRNENALDKFRHGTVHHLKGERNPSAKLTEIQVIKIREMLSSGISQAKIAEAMNMSKSAIWRIAIGKGWKHLN